MVALFTPTCTSEILSLLSKQDLRNRNNKLDIPGIKIGTTPPFGIGGFV